MIYVTSDLHGISVADFQELLRKGGFTDEDYLFILGDVIDRGPHGCEMLVWLTQQANMQLILGNHESMMLACRGSYENTASNWLDELKDDEVLALIGWLQNGGEPTLTGLQALAKRDPDVLTGVLEYLEEAPLYEVVRAGNETFVLVHAGLDNFQANRPLEKYSAEDLLWARPDPEDRYYSNATVILGHTPTEYFGVENSGRAFHTDTWICIDTGAAAGNAPMLLRLDDRKEFYL